MVWGGSVCNGERSNVPYRISGYSGRSITLPDYHVPIGFVLLPGALAQVRAGKVKALAVTTEQRVSAAPNLPTMAEAGTRSRSLRVGRTTGPGAQPSIAAGRPQAAGG